ncbi:MAG: ADOP family duplicated permease [Vicinamibacterales bacterium]
MLEAFHQAARSLRRQPAFSGSVVAIMALGIGACTAMFSIITAVFVDPLPYAEPERLAIIWHAQGDTPGVIGLSPSDYVTYRDTTRAFASVAAVATRGYNLGGGERPVRVTCGRVTPNLFSTLGVGAARGRWIAEDDDRDGRRVIVLADQMWRSYFGGDEKVVGREVLLDAVPHTVVGVMPASFGFPPHGIQGVSEAACWIPTSFSAADLATPAFDLLVVARLASGVGIDQAAEDASSAAGRIRDAYPAAVKSQVQLRARLVPLAEEMVTSSRTAILLVAGSALLLLLIGRANISNLLLTRLNTRRHEMTLRSALGASRTASDARPRRIACSPRPAVSLASSLAHGLIAVVSAAEPGNLPRLENARIDLSAAGFALLCAMGAGMAGGVAPALRANGGGTPARDGLERVSSGGIGRDRLRSTLVVLEVGMAVVVLAAATLLMRSMANLQKIDPGFDPAHVLTFSVALPSARYQQPVAIDLFARQLVDRLRQIPGVTFAAAGSTSPVGAADVAVVAPGDSTPGAPPFRPAAVQLTTANYHETWGIRVRRGRTFDSGDLAAAPPVAVVSETMARTYWPDADVVGRQMSVVGDPRPLTIVGVAADVTQGGPASTPAPAFYVPLTQSTRRARALSFALRASSDTRALASEVRRLVAEADATLPVFALQAADELLASSVATQKFAMLMAMALGLLALILAMSGLYAVMGYVVSQSLREYGIRMALGATRLAVVGHVTGRALRLVAGGVVLGASAAAGLSRLIASLLFGVQPGDPVTYVLVALVLGGVAAAAVALPVIRAMRVDPTACLRAL